MWCCEVCVIRPALMVCRYVVCCEVGSVSAAECGSVIVSLKSTVTAWSLCLTSALFTCWPHPSARSLTVLITVLIITVILSGCTPGATFSKLLWKDFRKNFGKYVGKHQPCLTLTYKYSSWTQHQSRIQFCCYCLIWDAAFWIRKSYNIHRPEIVVQHRMNVAPRHKEALAGQKMLLQCFSTFCGL